MNARELAPQFGERSLTRGAAIARVAALAVQNDQGLETQSAALEPQPLELIAECRCHQTVRSASVGESRAARSAGRSPAIAPIAIAAPSPPVQAETGTTTAQCFVLA